MSETALPALLARFTLPADRLDAAAKLSQLLGVERVLVFVRDSELGVLLPAQGFSEAVAGGQTWRAFVSRCASPGVYSAEVDYPHESRTSVTAYVLPDGPALFLFGGPPDGAAIAEVLAALPLLGALFGVEHQVRLARGEAAVAQATGRRAKELALALDSARQQLAGALAEAARLNTELQETDRRKDDFLAMLGHELRNPLAAISGAIEVMRERPDDLDQIARARAIIGRQTEQLARLVDDLLDVARITRGKIALRCEVLDVEQIVRRALEATHPLASAKHHEVRLQVRASVHTSADRTRLEQMVANLLTNAVKYTDPGGHIDVVVDRRGDDAVVEVKDDGIGIPPAMLPRIFDAFLQVDASIDRGAGGLGVGLTVVSGLAALQGGGVDATSTVGEGSTFTIRLPAKEAAVISPSTAPPAPPPGKRRVLVVDDNIDAAEMMVALAESWGHEAFHAADGPRAVMMAHELKPDVVLLDIGLPGMDGYAVAAKLRDDPVTEATRIIAVSGYGQEADRLKSRAAGCDEHLVKPVDLPSLERAIATTVSGSSASAISYKLR